MPVWKPIDDIRAGYVVDLSESICVVEAKNTDLLVPVTDGTMIVASDYSGQHKGASHEAYTFIVTTEKILQEWLPSLRAFRTQWLPDSRRISFKQLNEPVRRRALPAFLDLVAKLKGNLITIMIDRRVGSFMHGGPSAIKEAFPDGFPARASPGTVERMFRLANFVALILAGLRNEDQPSFWISDHDEALDSDNKREQFARLSAYLSFGLTGWVMPADHRFGTTESPMAPDWSEDIAAIPDLVAGAYCKMSDKLPTFFGVKNWRVVMRSDDISDLRAREIGNWLARRDSNLKHVLLRLELDDRGNVRASAQAILGGP